MRTPLSDNNLNKLFNPVATRFLVSLALLLAVLPTIAQGQTGLILVAEEGDQSWTEEVREILDLIEWRQGPLGLAFTSDPTELIQSMEILAVQPGERLEAVVLVPWPRSPAWIQDWRRTRGRSPMNGPLLVQAAPVGSVVVDMEPMIAARRVERVGLEAMARLTESGALLDGASSIGIYRLDGLNVTATRDVREVFSTPAPVTTISKPQIRERMPDNASDLFTGIPGLDVDGIGPNQQRPVIRGQRGQRVLLLEDGIRLNNTRRRVDSGEPPALVSLSELEQIEIIRGPSSVLYGSDAIGGVLNLRTVRPPLGLDAPDFRGELSVVGASAANLYQFMGRLSQSAGPVSLRLTGSYRESDPYDAPAGTFGEVSLNRGTRVQGSGVTDHGIGLEGAYQLTPSQEVAIRFNRYDADDAGFGFVDPDVFGDGLATTQLLFPEHTIEKSSLTYKANEINSVLADRFEGVGYWQSNERVFLNNIDSPFGDPFPPGAGLVVESENFTDLDTYGFRLEAKKLLGEQVLLTYGADLFRDRSRDTDRSTTTVTTFGPPSVSVRDFPRVPNSTLRSFGAFVQSELDLSSRAELVLGARYQDVHAENEVTPGIDDLELVEATDRTVVGTASLLFRAAEGWNVVASLGRGFRSANLVERFFAGRPPSGGGVVTPNPEIEAETSLNIDLGVRHQTDRISAELFVFRNTVRDGIDLQPTGDSIDGQVEHQSVNIDKIRYTGLEMAATIDLGAGLGLHGSYTLLDVDNVEDPDTPILSGYASKLIGGLRYTDPADRFWAEFSTRHNGKEEDVDIAGSFVGEVIPGFTVHELRGAIRLFDRNTLHWAVENLTDELYAEAFNADFFRPQPGRNFLLGWTVVF